MWRFALMAGALSGCGLFLDYDDHVVVGETPPPAECPGACSDGATCHAGSELAFCGTDGFACKNCDDGSDCTVDSCASGACTNDPLPDDTSCPSGVCKGGVCEELAENCTNAVDDNDDGLVDCADPICQSVFYSCTPTVMGWTGPVAFYLDNEVVSCAGSYADQLAAGQEGLEAPPAQCADCTCGASGCGNAQAELTLLMREPTVLGACQNYCLDAVVVPPLQCVGTTCAEGQAPVYDTYGVTVNPASSSCVPSDQPPPMLPAAMFNNNALVCSAPALGGGCAQNEVCAPRPAPPLSLSLCVYREGDQACPDATPYTQRTVFHEGFEDERHCTNCGCDNVSCTGTLTTWENSPQGGLCSGGTMSHAVPFSGCTFLDQVYSLSLSFAPNMQGCSVVPSAPAGAATPTGPHTLCCVP